MTSMSKMSKNLVSQRLHHWFKFPLNSRAKHKTLETKHLSDREPLFQLVFSLNSYGFSNELFFIGSDLEGFWKPVNTFPQGSYAVNDGEFLGCATESNLTHALRKIVFWVIQNPSCPNPWAPWRQSEFLAPCNCWGCVVWDSSSETEVPQIPGHTGRAGVGTAPQL